jgi:23S rRNA (cytosine1962-C5)-methyltransferase
MPTSMAPPDPRNPRKRPGPPRRGAAPVAVRRGTVRLPGDVAAKVRAGHPWVYREILAGRDLQKKTGDMLELVDPNGEFVARGLYDEEAIIAVRVMTRRPDETPGPELAARRAREAVALRRRFVPADIEATRLVNAESDGVPAISVDRYGDYLVAQLTSPAALGFRDAVYDELMKVTGAKALYEQRRFKSLGGEAPPRNAAELVRGTVAPVEVEVREGDLRFLVDVTAPLSTGLFLDLREGRRALRSWAKGRRVLNLFSYTGAISVYAQAGGATEIVAVDIAAKAHARARRNFTLSGFDAEKPEHIVGDVFKVLAKMVERKRQFDMVILDPPAFGTGGKGQVFSAVQDFRELIAESLRVLAPEGLIVACSSTHKISHEEFDRMLAAGATDANAALRVLDRRWLPPDFCISPGFPEGNYLKFAIAMRE